MPKAPTDAASEKSKLKRGQACISCRSRKMKCDAIRPVCTSCMRTYNHLCQRVKPGQERPPYPDCVFEEEVVAPAPSSARALESRIQQLEGMLKQAVGAEGLERLASSSGIATPTGGESSGGKTSNLSTSVDNGRHRQPSLPFPLPSFPPSEPPSHPQFRHNQPPQFTYETTNLPPPTWPSLASFSSFSPRPSQQDPDTFPPGPSFSFPPSQQPSSFHSSPAVSPPTARDVYEELGLSRPGSVAEGSGISSEVPESPEDYLLQLLWPSWPPHLPSPGKLEMIVETFFLKVPFATELLNKARFLTRLALPPRHRHFPHPALLHAICAASARFLGDLTLLPPDEFPSLSFPPKTNTIEPDAYPRWDGFGPKPAVTTPYVDGDFGEIHHFWGSLYVSKHKHNADLWLPLVQATVMLSMYSHQTAKWIQGWLHLMDIGRLIVPLGLNGRTFSTVTTRSMPRDSILEPAEDDIERIERQNLFWLVYTSDTYHLTSCGWMGALDDRDIYLGLPTSRSTFPVGSSPPYATQFADDEDEDLFSSSRPEHANSFSIQIKGTILLRKVSDFVRRADKKGIEAPRETARFRQLDGIIESFRCSFPPDLSNPLCFDPNGALDRDLIMAHSLAPVSVITLHDRYFDLSDASDPSGPRMLNAARALLSQVYLLTSTNFFFPLLHPFMSYAWYLGAKTLIKHMSIASQNGDTLNESILAGEVQVFRNAIARVAEHLPIGSRQLLALDHFHTSFSANTNTAYLNPLCFPVAMIVADFDGTASSGSISTPPSIAGGGGGGLSVDYPFREQLQKRDAASSSSSPSISRNWGSRWEEGAMVRNW